MKLVIKNIETNGENAKIKIYENLELRKFWNRFLAIVSDWAENLGVGLEGQKYKIRFEFFGIDSPSNIQDFLFRWALLF